MAAWGTIKLLEANETCTNEVVFKLDPNNPNIYHWLGQKLNECDYNAILNCVSTPNLPAWRLRKWLKEQWDLENKVN